MNQKMKFTERRTPSEEGLSIVPRVDYNSTTFSSYESNLDFQVSKNDYESALIY